MDPTWEKALFEKLKTLYYGKDSPAYMSSVSNLYYTAKQHKLPVTIDLVKKFLQSSDAYTNLRPLISRFPRRPYLIAAQGMLVDLDLVDFSRIRSYNRRKAYILVAVDFHSSLTFAEAMNSKKPTETAKAMTKILDDIPFQVYNCITDRGGEFTGKAFRDLLKSHGITHRYTRGLHKVSVVERRIRDIKHRIGRTFDARQSKQWIDVYKNVVNSINHSLHTRLRMRPVDITPEDASTVMHRRHAKYLADLRKMQLPSEQSSVHRKFNLGDCVKIMRPNLKKGVTARMSAPRYSEEVYIISNIVYGPIPLYQLRSLDGTRVERNFYAQELALVSVNAHRIARVRKLGTRVKAGRKEIRVELLSDRTKKWVKDSEFVPI